MDSDLQSDLSAVGDFVTWSSASSTGTASIHELTVSRGSIRTVYSASAGASVDVKSSDGWLVWLEARDRFRFSDGRLLAQGRTGGAVIVLDDARQHPDRALFPMWCIDGADAYWTMPEVRDGRVTGALMHKHLPDGPTETVIAASPGEVVSAPSAAHGTVAYELASDSSPTHVAVRWSDGTFRAFPDPSSGPSVGDGFVALKAGPPDADASIVALWPDGHTTNLGNGQRAVAGGAWVAWGTKRREPVDPQGVFPVFVSRSDATCFARFSPPSVSDHQVSISGFIGDVAAAVVTDTSGATLHEVLLLVRLTLTC